MSSAPNTCIAVLAPLAAAVCTAFLAMPAIAQPSTGTADGGSSASGGKEARPVAEKQESDNAKQLDLVTVTATRRREPIREVPMQVNVMQAEALQEGGAKSLADYLSVQPGIDLNSQGSPGLGGVSMRGVSTGQQATATVGVCVDEIASGSSGAWGGGGITSLDMALLDLSHIEILRGPQGTLYGAGAMGGLLKYVTNEPDTYDLSGKVALGISSTRFGRPGLTVNGVVNIPLQSGVAGIRVAAFSDRAGGYVDAVGPAGGSDVNRGQTRGARASMLITPMRHLKVRLTATQQTIEREGRDLVTYETASGRPVAGDLVRRQFVTEYAAPRLNLYSGDIEYDISGTRLNLIVSHQSSSTPVKSDLSEQYLPLLAKMGVIADGVTFRSNLSQSKDTQELRLTSKADKRFEWLLGLFSAQESATQHQEVNTVMAGGLAGPQLLLADVPSSYREIAAYGNATWKFESGLSLTAGLRSARNQQSVSQISSGLLYEPVVRDGTSSDSTLTQLLAAAYAIDPSSSVYFRYATGYRPGGPNTVILDGSGKPLTPAFFGPDTLKSYEIGYKADFLSRRLALEIAAYDIEWKNVQQMSSVGGLSVIVNGGAARVRGAELSGTYRATNDLSMSASGTIIDGRLREDWAGLNGKAGDRMPSSAKFSASLSARYGFVLAGMPTYASLSQRFVGDRRAGFAGSPLAPDYALPAYALTDLQAGFDWNRVNVSAYLRNLFDSRPQLGSYPLGSLPGQTYVSVGQPRSIGITAALAF